MESLTGPNAEDMESLADAGAETGAMESLAGPHFEDMESLVNSDTQFGPTAARIGKGMNCTSQLARFDMTTAASTAHHRRKSKSLGKACARIQDQGVATRAEARRNGYLAMQLESTMHTHGSL